MPTLTNLLKSVLHPVRSSGGRHIQSDLWSSQTRLIDLTGQGDWVTLGDVYSGGIAVFGSAGSGKTSSMALIAYALMKVGCAFCWLCAKSEELHLALRIAECAGRADDIVILGENTLGRISGHRFNPLAYEASVPTTGTSSLALYLSDCAKILSRKEGERNPAEGERFWVDQFERILRHCIDTAKLAGRPLSVALLRQIQLTAPRKEGQMSDERWQEASVCWQCLREAEIRLEAGEISERDFNQVYDFWIQDYYTLDNRPRSSIDVSFAVLADAFCGEEPLRTILTTNTTITPEQAMEGKIVILSLPTNVYYGAGRMAQFCFKYSLQRAVLRRNKHKNSRSFRPVVIWCDEAHAFAHPFDATYFAECRSSRGINVYLEQSVGGYMRALGLSQVSEVDGFLQNLATKIFFQSNSPQTNEFAADAIGKLWTAKTSASISTSVDKAQVGETTSEEARHQVISGLFGLLKRGGVENNRIVQGYVLKPGLFRATGSNVARCEFLQTDLTR